jgi:hypothetical protein
MRLQPSNMQCQNPAISAVDTLSCGCVQGSNQLCLLLLQESAWGQVPVKQRALVCAEFAGQLLRYHVAGYHLDLKLQNMVVGSFEGVLAGKAQLKIIDGDTAQTPLQLLLHQWYMDASGTYRSRPLVSHLCKLPGLPECRNVSQSNECRRAWRGCITVAPQSVGLCMKCDGVHLLLPAPYAASSYVSACLPWL